MSVRGDKKGKMKLKGSWKKDAKRSLGLVLAAALLIVAIPTIPAKAEETFTVQDSGRMLGVTYYYSKDDLDGNYNQENSDYGYVENSDDDRLAIGTRYVRVIPPASVKSYQLTAEVYFVDGSNEYHMFDYISDLGKSAEEAGADGDLMLLKPVFFNGNDEPLESPTGDTQGGIEGLELWESHSIYKKEDKTVAAYAYGPSMNPGENLGLHSKFADYLKTQNVELKGSSVVAFLCKPENAKKIKVTYFLTPYSEGDTEQTENNAVSENLLGGVAPAMPL